MTELNYEPGVRITPDGLGRQWWATNGIAPPIPLCGVCNQFVYEGHVDCTCDKNHPEICQRPTYDELKARHDALVAALDNFVTWIDSPDNVIKEWDMNPKKFGRPMTALRAALEAAK